MHKCYMIADLLATVKTQVPSLSTTRFYTSNALSVPLIAVGVLVPEPLRVLSVRGY